MKFYSAVITGILLLMTIACGSSGSDKNPTYSGTIETAGITSYQYGTHVLKAENTFYALKSDKVQLNNYEGENVTIQAEKVNGYPLDGGPVFLKVTKIIE